VVSRRTHGLRGWVLQRLTALYLALFLVYLLAHLILSPPGSVHEWRAWVGDPLVNGAWAVFFAALLMHAWVGVRDVVMDYVGPAGLRLGVLFALGLYLFALGYWALVVLLAVAP
jgi:succinate dehydrogenase / fumarate reductase membrane anchor subunit